MNRPGNENVTRHTSPPLILHDSPHGEIAESENRRIVPFICRRNFRSSRTCIVLFARRETSIQEHITGKRHYPVERNATNNSTACFCCATRKNCSRASGNLERGTVVSPSRSRVNRQIFILLLVGMQLPWHWIQIPSVVLVRTMNSDASLHTKFLLEYR